LTFPESKFNVIIGNGDGTFQPPQTTRISDNAYRVFIGDFDHDGNLDAIAAHTSTFLYGYTTLMGNGDGTFQDPVFFSLPSGETPANVGDLNGDGNLDLITVSEGVIGVRYGNGDGTFQAPVENEAAGFVNTLLLVNDFNQDGSPDLAVCNSEDTVSIFLNLRGTRVVVTSKPNPSKVGDVVTFHVTAQPSITGQPTPSGMVTLKDGSNLLASTTLQAGRAQYRTSKLSVGTHVITVEYSGDGNYNANTGPPLAQIVNP